MTSARQKLIVKVARELAAADFKVKGVDGLDAYDAINAEERAAYRRTARKSIAILEDMGLVHWPRWRKT